MKIKVVCCKRNIIFSGLAERIGEAWTSAVLANAILNTEPAWRGPRFLAMMRRLIIVGTGTAINSVPTWLWAQATSGTGAREYIRGPHMMWDGGWFGMIFGPIFMILLLAVLIAAIVLVVRWASSPSMGAPPHHVPPERAALDILKERYARGEIDRDEYMQRKADLQN
jgi:putative membrane protein